MLRLQINSTLKKIIMKKIISGLFCLVSISLIIYFVNSTQSVVSKKESCMTIVSTKQGKYKGYLDKSRNLKPYVSFLGINYGKVLKRFQEAIEVNETWDYVKDATSFGPSCLEVGPNPNGDEDCLFLNIFTTNIAENFPVLFFIHGGSFAFGSGNSYGPKYLMDEDVVLVTLNYRLGTFGFLNVGTNDANGNMGLTDLILALKWVQRNIENFGGDSNKVTLYGSSAGAAAVSILILSPITQGLFHAGISSSGSILSPWAFTNDSITPAKQLAASLDCPSNDLEYMVDCLRKIDPKILARKCGSIELGIGKNPPPYFLPSIDQNLIPVEPSKMFNYSRKVFVPWIIGINSNEGFATGAFQLTSTISWLSQLNNHWSRVLSRALILNCDDFCTHLSKLKQFYFNNTQIESENEEHLQSLANLFTDRFFFHGSKKAAKEYQGNAYFYVLNFSGQFSIAGNLMKNLTKKIIGATHEDDLFYLFNDQSFMKNEVPDDDFVFMSKRITNLFVQFAKTKRPLIKKNKNWIKVSNGETLNYLEMNSPYDFSMTSESQSISNRLNIWNELN